MATYKNIQGFKVPTYAADPVIAQGWSVGGSMNQQRYQMGAAGTSTAAVTGMGSSPYPYLALVEEYNGTGWTEVTNHPLAAGYASMSWCGLQTAALVAGGYHGPPGAGPWADCFLYDGTNWSTTGSMASVRTQGGLNGITSAALWAGGQAPALLNLSEEFNGSTWAVGNTLNTARNNNVNAGSQTDAITIGGAAPGAPGTYQAEGYNGTSWVVGGIINNGRQGMQNPGGGTVGTASIVCAGNGPAATAFTETYNGTAWTELPAMPYATHQGGGAGPATNYLTCGGGSPVTTATVIYSENSEPNTFLLEGQVWYNSTDGDLKFYDGSAIKTVTVS